MTTRSRTSQKEIINTFDEKGIEAVEEILQDFPNCKQTFAKVIEAFAEDEGRDADDVRELQKLFDDTFGAKVDAVTQWDTEVLKTAQEIADLCNVPLAKIYSVSKKMGINAEAVYREPGQKGRGKSLYNFEEMRKALDNTETTQAEGYVEEYDTEEYLTRKDMLELKNNEGDMIFENAVEVSAFLNISRIKPTDTRHRSGSVGKGASLYRTHLIKNAIEVWQRALGEIHAANGSNN